MLMEEFLSKKIPEHIAVHRIKNADEIKLYPDCIACFDLLYGTLNGIKFNSWPGFINRSVIEIAGINDEAESILKQLQWEYKQVPDQPGFISARVIAMIINEAYLTLGEGVSTKEEIDTAMKLGTNYPYGPFEWCEKIGAKRVHSLLIELAKSNSRYQPASLLAKEAGL